MYSWIYSSRPTSSKACVWKTENIDNTILKLNKITLLYRTLLRMVLNWYQIGKLGVDSRKKIYKSQVCKDLDLT